MASANTKPFSMLSVTGACTNEGASAVEQLGASLCEEVAALSAEVRAAIARVGRVTRAVQELAAAYDAAADDAERQRGP